MWSWNYFLMGRGLVPLTPAGCAKLLTDSKKYERASLTGSSLTPREVWSVITARRRSHVFTPVCHSVHRAGWLPSMHHRSHDQGHLHQGGLPRGRFALGGGWTDTPHRILLWDAVTEWAVHILLECILVRKLTTIIYWLLHKNFNNNFKSFQSPWTDTGKHPQI